MYACMVSCAQRSKNLERYLLYRLYKETIVLFIPIQRKGEREAEIGSDIDLNPIDPQNNVT